SGNTNQKRTIPCATSCRRSWSRDDVPELDAHRSARRRQARKGVLRMEHLPNSVRSPAVSVNTDVELEIRRLVDRMVSEAPAGEVFRWVEAKWEKALFRRVLEATHGNQLKASELMGITRTTVKRKLDLHGL